LHIGTLLDMAAAVAELQGVSKHFGSVVALDRVDLTLRAGEVTAILGPNGAGKTTAVRLMLGLAQPSAGEARLLGRNPTSIAARERVGVMLQVSKVPETLRVAEHIRLFSSYYPMPLPLAEIIDLAGLTGLENRAFGKLSGGQQQRLLFALAICGDPEFLVLDEPTVGLDVEARRAFWSEMRRLVARGRSLLLTTHYLEEADSLADRIVILQAGRIIADGPPADIKARVAGKQVRCVTRLDADALMALPGARGWRQDKHASVISVTDVERFVRELLAEDPSVSDLEISSANLEQAFIELTTPAPQHGHRQEAR
jgi:ABC-2 type transport system ATP-binding protein